MLRAVASSTGFQLGSLGVQLVDRFVLSALILQAWGVAAFEDWAILFAAAGLFNLLDFGLQQALSNAYTRAYQGGDKARFSHLMAMGIGLNSAVALVGVLVLLGLLALGGGALVPGLRALAPGEALIVFAAFAVATILQTAAACLIVMYRAQARFARGLALELALATTRTLAVFFAVLAGADPVAAALIHAGVSVGFFLIVLPADVRHSLKALRFRPATPKAEDWAMLRRTAPYFYAQHATTLLLLQLPTLVLGAMTANAGAGAVAMFLFVRMLMNFARTLVQFLAISISVEVARLQAAGVKPEVVGRHVSKAARFSAALTGVAVGGLVPATGPLLQVWSGGTVDAAMPVVIALGAGLLLTGPFIVMAAVLNLIGFEKVCAASKLVNALTALGLCLALAAPLGPLGVALALAAGEIVGLGLMLVAPSARVIGRAALGLGLEWLLAAGIGAGVMGLAVAGLLALVPGGGLGALALSGALSAPIALGVMAAVGLEGAERRALTARIKPLLARWGLS